MPYSEARAEEQIRQSEDTKQRIYNFLVLFTQNNLFPPTTREICERLNIKSTSTVWTYLKKLENEGKIEIRNEGARCITLKGYKLIKED